MCIGGVHTSTVNYIVCAFALASPPELPFALDSLHVLVALASGRRIASRACGNPICVVNKTKKETEVEGEVGKTRRLQGPQGAQGSSQRQLEVRVARLEMLIEMIGRLTLSNAALNRLLRAILIQCNQGKNSHGLFHVMKVSRTEWLDRNQSLIKAQVYKRTRELRIGMCHVVTWNSVLKKTVAELTKLSQEKDAHAKHAQRAQTDSGVYCAHAAERNDRPRSGNASVPLGQLLWRNNEEARGRYAGGQSDRDDSTSGYRPLGGRRRAFEENEATGTARRFRKKDQHSLGGDALNGDHAAQTNVRGVQCFCRRHRATERCEVCNCPVCAQCRGHHKPRSHNHQSDWCSCEPPLAAVTDDVIEDPETAPNILEKVYDAYASVSLSVNCTMRPGEQASLEPAFASIAGTTTIVRSGASGTYVANADDPDLRVEYCYACGDELKLCSCECAACGQYISVCKHVQPSTCTAAPTNPSAVIGPQPTFPETLLSSATLPSCSFQQIRFVAPSNEETQVSQVDASTHTSTTSLPTQKELMQRIATEYGPPKCLRVHDLNQPYRAQHLQHLNRPYRAQHLQHWNQPYRAQQVTLPVVMPLLRVSLRRFHLHLP